MSVKPGVWLFCNWEGREMVNNFGYTDRILRVDLSSGKMTNISTMNYAERFLGGRGIAAKIYWDEVSPDVKALDPENRLIFITGPLAGVPGLAGSRWQVCGKSPAAVPEHFCHSNLGGSWGAYLRFAGYDGIIVQGKSDKPVYLFLHDGIAEIRDASSIWGRRSTEVQEVLKSELGRETRVVASGTAGDNMVVFASLLADEDSSGAAGFGAVMGSKRLKAIAVAGNQKVTVADPEKLQELNRYIRELKRGIVKQPQEPLTSPRMRRQLCWGCIGGCNRATYQADNGKRGKFMCQAASVYQSWARRYYREQNDVPFRATKLCDDYGLDTKAVSPMLTWLSRCQQAGILTDKTTGLPISQLGSLEFIEALLLKISLREGFGDVLAQGTLQAASVTGNEAAEQLADFPFKGGNRVTYDPRMYLTTGLFYMVESRLPVPLLHEVSHLVVQWLKWVNNEKDAYVTGDAIRSIASKFWGSELAADFSTYAGKAQAARIIQDREYAKESLNLCDLFWPITDVKYSADHVGDPGLESRLVSAVTGQELAEDELYRVGERVFNLQRAILVREGHQGRQSDSLPEACYTIPLESDSRNAECLVPGEKGEVVSKKGALFDRSKFEEMKSEYYALRGWDVTTGLQTEAKLAELELGDISQDLKIRGLVL